MSAGPDPFEPATPAGGGGLVRLRFDLGYDGTGFAGWARQPGRRTVQETVETALRTVLHLDAQPDGAPPDRAQPDRAQPASRSVALTVAGRTDAGVHALGQVAHADVPDRLLDPRLPAGPPAGPDLATLLRRLNGVLPDDVRVFRVSRAPAGFDARFSALARHYAYRVVDRPADPLRRRETLCWPRRLDLAAMRAAAVPLLGEHDFAAFCRSRDGATTVRRLFRFDWARDLDGVATAWVSADAFCHSMVRALVGAALAVGDGRRPSGWPAEVLGRAVRDPSVQVVPARGLTLLSADYPPEGELAARAAHTRRLRAPARPAAP